MRPWIIRNSKDWRDNTMVATTPTTELTNTEQSNMLLIHDSKLAIHDDTLEQHGMAIRLQAEQIKQLQQTSLRLENVVMRENSETRTTITNTNKQLMDLMNAFMGYKTGENEMTTNEKIKRWESIAKIVGVLAGSGGILYYLFGYQ